MSSPDGSQPDHTPVPEYESPNDLCMCLHERKWHTDTRPTNGLNEGCRPTLPHLGKCVCLCDQFVPFQEQYDEGAARVLPNPDAGNGGEGQ